MNDRDLPELNQGTYVKETALALWEGLPRILLAGLWFTLVSTPAVVLFLLGFAIPGILLGIFSIGPGYAAMCSAIARSILREPFTLGEFFKAFGHFYLRGLQLGFWIALPLISAVLLLPTLAHPPVSTPIWVGLGADVAGFTLLSALYLYAYPQVVMYDIRVTTALKNSLLLAAKYLSNTLGLMAMALLLAILAVKVSYFLLAVFLVGWLVFVINNCRMAIRLELGEKADPRDSHDLE